MATHRPARRPDLEVHLGASGLVVGRLHLGSGRRRLGLGKASDGLSARTASASRKPKKPRNAEALRARLDEARSLQRRPSAVSAARSASVRLPSWAAASLR